MKISSYIQQKGLEKFHCSISNSLILFKKKKRRKIVLLWTMPVINNGRHFIDRCIWEIELQSVWSQWDDIHRIFTTRKRTHIYQDQVRVSFSDWMRLSRRFCSLPLALPFSIQGSKRYSKSCGTNFLFQRYLQKDLVHHLSITWI